MKDTISRRAVLAGLPLVSAALLSDAAITAAAPLSTAPAPAPADTAASRELLRQYFLSHARQLLRAPSGVLRFPSISPSLPKATYSADLWDWDTLWTTRGLLSLGQPANDTTLQADILVHAQGSLANFFDHQSDDGRIPMLITTKEVDPLGCLRGPRPHKENQAKPVLAQLALLIADKAGDSKWFEPYFEKLDRFYDSWRADNLSATGLLVWGDDVAIGNDNDPTTFGRPFFSSANLLLNCLYYQDLKSAAELANRLGRATERHRFQAQAEALAQAIQRHCWDPRDRFFYTADVQCVDRRAELLPKLRRGMDMGWNSIPLRVQTFTGFLPMWCNIATSAQAQEMVKHMANQQTIGAPYGVRTLSAAESMYSLVASSNPSNWLGPVWIISNYLVWKALMSNGFKFEAQQIASLTVSMLARDLATSGSLNEYYHPETGQPLSHKGFMDWNLLVLEMT